MKFVPFAFLAQSFGFGHGFPALCCVLEPPSRADRQRGFGQAAAVTGELQAGSDVGSAPGAACVFRK